MKTTGRFIAFILLLSIAYSCTSTKNIQTNMNSKRNSLAYIMDSEIASTKSEVSVFTDTVIFDPALLNDLTLVTREKGWFIPLVFVYIWNSTNNCIQGRSIMEEDPAVFLKTSLNNEINRSGYFKTDSLKESEYSLELSIDEIKADGPYVSKGFFYFALYAYGFSYGDYAGPANASLKISYQLKKNGQLTHSNTFGSEKNTEQIRKRYNNLALLQQDYATSMVEATSYNFKKISELIVNDLNTYFKSQLSN
jgi:hypothetical protein